jgi:hypothetical protein
VEGVIPRGEKVRDYGLDRGVQMVPPSWVEIKSLNGKRAGIAHVYIREIGNHNVCTVV